MKLKLTDNLFLKILSVLVAVVLWMVVVNINDTVKTESYPMEVALLNTEVVTGNGKVFWVEDGTNMVKVKVRARESVLEKLSPTDFILTADMEKDLKYDSLVGITVECRNKNIIADEDISLSRSNVTVHIEDAATEQFQIRVTYTGNPNDGMIVGSLLPEQTIIKVTGPVSIVEKIKKVEAVVDVTGLPGTSVRNCALKFYDGADNPIDTTYLNYAGKSNGIDVTVSMLNKKSVPLVFSYMGTPAENYEVSSIQWKPEYIEIASNPTVLSGITSLEIPQEVINVEGIDEELQMVVDITPYLPSGVILTDEDSASVLVIVELEYVEPEGEEKSEKKKKTAENTTNDKDPSTGTGSTNKSNLSTGTGTSAGTASGENQNKNEMESDKNEKPKSNS